MNQWLCVKVTALSQRWTLGKVYMTTKEGRLIDDDGRVRLMPVEYNKGKKSGKFSTLFEPYETSLENK